MEERKRSVTVSVTEKQLENIFSKPTIKKRYQELLPKKEQALKIRIEEINAFLIENEREAIQEEVLKEEFLFVFKGTIFQKAFERMIRDNEFDMQKNILYVLDEGNLEEAIQGRILPSITRKLVGARETDTFWDAIHLGSFLLRFDEKFLGDKTLKAIMKETEE